MQRFILETPVYTAPHWPGLLFPECSCGPEFNLSLQLDGKSWREGITASARICPWFPGLWWFENKFFFDIVRHIYGGITLLLIHLHTVSDEITHSISITWTFDHLSVIRVFTVLSSFFFFFKYPGH